ncbi:hypothetical protein BDW02DRAFT_605151 [Decorospora gaudefroyi]|uniref:PA14 domain-containing protein n=1 Tax=Decorospora gaudefroyi TaxID=184978 RepID=A0A6A5K6I0_9PLEO|nr:hypothetical protein BDW02DRAFT_605151 [Decorospora gaudefroyi]
MAARSDSEWLRGSVIKTWHSIREAELDGNLHRPEHLGLGITRFPQATYWYQDFDEDTFFAGLSGPLSPGNYLYEILLGTADGFESCYSFLWEGNDDGQKMDFLEADPANVPPDFGSGRQQFKLPRSKVFEPESSGQWHDVFYPWSSGRTAYCLDMSIQILRKIWKSFPGNPPDVAWHNLVALLCFAGVRKGFLPPGKDQSLSTWLRRDVYPKHVVVAQVALHFLDDLHNVENYLTLPLGLKMTEQAFYHLMVGLSFQSDDELSEWPDSPRLGPHSWDPPRGEVTKFALEDFLGRIARYSKPSTSGELAISVPNCLYARLTASPREPGMMAAQTIPNIWTSQRWGDIYRYSRNLLSGANEVRAQQVLIDLKRYIRGTGISSVDKEDQKARLEALVNFTGLSNFQDILVKVDDYSCTDCDSIFSASAYLLELIRFLPSDAATQLLTRRPDLNNLLLSCANTNITLPYLDIANEIMAEKIWTLHKNQSSSSVPVSDLNTADDAEAEDLRGTPTNQLPSLHSPKSVYTMQPFVISGDETASVSWAPSVRLPSTPFASLPYDLGIHEMSVLFTAFKMSRYDVMMAFRNPWAIPIALNIDSTSLETTSTSLWHPWNTPSGLDEAFENHKNDLLLSQEQALLRALQCETLGLLPMDFLAITGEGLWDDEYWGLQISGGVDTISGTILEHALKPLPPVAQLWGYDNDDEMFNEADGILSLEHGFIKKSGLSYVEYMSLVKSYSVGRYNETDRRLFRDNDDPLHVTPLDVQYVLEFDPSEDVHGIFAGLQAFLRLKTRMRISVIDLDVALHIWGGFDSAGGVIFPDFLTKATALVEIQNLTNIDYTYLLTLWSDLATTGDCEFAKSLFGSRNVRKIDQKFVDWINDDLGSSADSESLMLFDHVPAILASLGISQKALSLIAQSQNIDLAAEGERLIDAKTLSALLRYVVLCRCFQIAFEDAGTLLTVFPDILKAPFDPIDGNEPESPTVFLQRLRQWRQISSTGLSIREVASLIDESSQSDQLTLEYFRKESFRIAVGFQSLVARFPAADDAALAFTPLEGLLESLFKEDDISVILAVLRGHKAVEELAIDEDLYFIMEEFSAYTEEGLSLDAMVLRLYRHLLPVVLRAERTRIVSESVFRMLDTEDAAMLEFGLGVVEGQIGSGEKKMEEIVAKFAAAQLESGGDAWIGSFSPDTSGKYSFEFATQQTAQVIVDGVPLDWVDNAEGQRTKATMLSAEKSHNIQLSSQQVSLRLWSLGSSKLVPLSRGTFLSSRTVETVAKTVRALKCIVGPISTMKLTAEEVLFWQWHGDSRRAEEGTEDETAGLDANLVPWGSRLDPVDFNHLSLSAVEQLCIYSQLKEQLEHTGHSTVENQVLQNFKAGTEGTLVSISKTIVEGTEIDAGVAEILLRIYGGLNPKKSDAWAQDSYGVDDVVSSPSSSICNEHTMVQLLRSMDYLKRLKINDVISLKTMLHIAQPISDELSWKESSIMAINLRQLLRNRVGFDEWNKTIVPINDSLRRQRRDAMIAVLLRQPAIRDAGYKDADSLFEYFYMDVQMDTSLQTSRIKQAISSVQTFTQRAILGLEGAGVDSEGHLQPFEIDRRKWTWLQKFRVWEANRKVLAYPENWMTASNLDVKSALFSRFEAAISKGALTEEVLQEQTREYFSTLNELSHLDYVAYAYTVTTQKVLKPVDVVDSAMVFGRTMTKPWEYFYRTRDRHYGWSHWQSLGLSIPSTTIGSGETARDGSWLLPLFVGPRRMLFIPRVTLCFTTDDNNDQNAKVPPQELMRNATGFDIELSSSEWVNGAWSEVKQLEAAALRTKFASVETAVESLFFTTDAAETVNDVPTKLMIWAWTASSEESSAYDSLGGFSFDINSGRCKTESSSGTFGYASLPATSFNTIVPNGEVDEVDNAGFVIPAHLEPDEDHAMCMVRIQKPLVANYQPCMLISEDDKSLTESLYVGSISELVASSATGDVHASFEAVSMKVSGPDFGGLSTEAGNQFDFDIFSQPWSAYYWETGFFLPMLAAEKFLETQQFDEALAAVQVIFDPRLPSRADDGSHWKFLPFQQYQSANLETLLETLVNFTPAGRHLEVWSDKPFQPHVAARANIVSYMSWTVMRYVEILIAYGDFYFRQDTMETVPSAIQCYIEASQALGKRSQVFPAPEKKARSLADVSTGDGDGIEIILELMQRGIVELAAGEGETWLGAKTLSSTYFCTPTNPKLTVLGDTIKDRLFKIRHSMDIHGSVRTLALFQPSIDPGLLVSAVASGSLQLSNVLSELSAPLVNVRFANLLARARRICQHDLAALGRLLFRTMRQKDQQELETILAVQGRETEDLKLGLTRMEKECAEQSSAVLLAQRANIEQQLRDVLRLVGVDADAGIPDLHKDFAPIQSGIEEEFGADSGHERRTKSEVRADAMHVKLAQDRYKQHKGMAVAYGYSIMLPEVTFEVLLPLATGSMGYDLAEAVRTSAQTMFYRREAGFFKDEQARDMQYLKSERVSRLRDWKLEANKLGFGLMELDRQIKLQDTLIRSADKAIEFQQSNLQSARDIERFHNTRATNNDFYTWMQKSVQDVYFETYTVAYDLAKKAERAYFFEKGLDRSASAPLIDTYWDATNNGLLAGEKLRNGLYRLEQAYAETRGFDFEVTKRVSLKKLAPAALETLLDADNSSAEPTVDFHVPELDFDRDFPGHFRRRIKSVSVTVINPTPATDLAATLTLLAHRTRVSTALKDGVYTEQLGTDERFRNESVPINAIAVATEDGKETASTLEFDAGEGFRPFEGAGAVSSWRLEISSFTGYPVGEIQDVVLRLRYTASNGGGAFKEVVRDHVQGQMEG